MESSPRLHHGPAIGIEFHAAREEAGGEAVLRAWGNNWENPSKVWSSWWFQPIWKILVKLEIFPK